MSIGGPMSWDTRSQYLTVPHSIHQYTSSVRKAAASVGVTVTSPVKESSPGASFKKASWTMSINAIPKRNPAPLNTAKRRVAAIRTRGRPVLGTNVTTFAGVSRSRWGNCSARIGADERYRRNCAKDWRGRIERENARLSLVSLENRHNAVRVILMKVIFNPLQVTIASRCKNGCVPRKTKSIYWICTENQRLFTAIRWTLRIPRNI